VPTGAPAGIPVGACSPLNRMGDGPPGGLGHWVPRLARFTVRTLRPIGSTPGPDQRRPPRPIGSTPAPDPSTPSPDWVHACTHPSTLADGSTPAPDPSTPSPDGVHACTRPRRPLRPMGHACTRPVDPSPMGPRLHPTPSTLRPMGSRLHPTPSTLAPVGPRCTRPRRPSPDGVHACTRPRRPLRPMGSTPAPDPVGPLRRWGPRWSRPVDPFARWGSHACTRPVGHLWVSPVRPDGQKHHRPAISGLAPASGGAHDAGASPESGFPQGSHGPFCSVGGGRRWCTTGRPPARPGRQPGLQWAL